MKVEKNLKILAPKSCKSKHNPLSYEPMYWWCTCCTSHALVMWLQVMHQNIYSQNWIVKDVQDQKGLISAMRSNGPLPPSPDNWRSGPARVHQWRYVEQLQGKNNVWEYVQYIHCFNESRSLESKANHRERIDLGFVQVVRQLQLITHHSPLVDA